jgi:Uncharacterized conserved protein
MIELIQKRFDEYKVANPVAEVQAIKEIMQEITLYALWRTGFFEVAAFQDGTCLRILHKLPRFSEDLDFILKEPDSGFAWNVYLRKLSGFLEEFGIMSEVIDKSRLDKNLRKAVLKDSALVNQLNLSFLRGNNTKKLQIKLEIDINPPEGSVFGYSYLDFPADYEVCHQDLNSNLALKIHALLCRPYLKGRDWYDFGWYAKQNDHPNLRLLKAALYQYGPWQGKKLMVNKTWLKQTLLEKISGVDWKAAAADVERFLNTTEKEGLKLWSERFFSGKVEKLLP